MEQKAHFYKILEKHVPPNSVHYCYDIWIQHPFSLKITRSRNSKLGDYRYNPQCNTHTISINHNLNSYNFLITYIHEVAHLIAFMRYGKNKKPHGIEWKKCFQELIDPLLSNLIFPDDILSPLIKYMKNPAASSCSDKDLYKALRFHDQESHLHMLLDLIPGDRFVFHKRLFEIEQVRRTKALCREINTGKKYLIPQLAMVDKLEQPPTSMISFG